MAQSEGADGAESAERARVREREGGRKDGERGCETGKNCTRAPPVLYKYIYMPETGRRGIIFTAMKVGCIKIPRRRRQDGVWRARRGAPLPLVTVRTQSCVKLAHLQSEYTRRRRRRSYTLFCVRGEISGWKTVLYPFLIFFLFFSVPSSSSRLTQHRYHSLLVLFFPFVFRFFFFNPTREYKEEFPFYRTAI